MFQRLLQAGIRPVRRVSGAFVLAVGAAAALALFSNNYYLVELLTTATLVALFAASWDVFCGPTRLDNFGHAAFIGAAAYSAALLNTSFGIPVWLTVPAAAIVAALLGLAIGWLSLRLHGPYFALSTLAFAAALYKLAFVLSAVTRGEDGLSGVAPLSSSPGFDLILCLAALTVSVSVLTRFSESHFGLVLRATSDNVDIAAASGVDTARYKILGFGLSALFGGLAGGLYAHTRMQANPEMLAGSLSVSIVLFAVIGGRGTILGPVFSAALLTALNEYLRVLGEWRLLVFGALLVALIYLNPYGVANARLLRNRPAMRRFLLGSRSLYDSPLGSRPR